MNNVNENKQIEVELRAIYDEQKHAQLKLFLDKNAEDIGEDNKEVYFFLYPDRIYKVAHNISKGTVKVGARLNRLGSGRSDFEEIEFLINKQDYDKAVRLFSSMEFEDTQKTYQERHNYIYKEVEIALKYSDSWGYHMELEKVVHDEAEIDGAKSHITAVADEMGVSIMTEEEITAFAKKIDNEYKQDKR